MKKTAYVHKKTATLLWLVSLVCVTFLPVNAQIFGELDETEGRFFVQVTSMALKYADPAVFDSWLNNQNDLTIAARLRIHKNLFFTLGSGYQNVTWKTATPRATIYGFDTFLLSHLYPEDPSPEAAPLSRDFNMKANMIPVDASISLRFLRTREMNLYVYAGGGMALGTVKLNDDIHSLFDDFTDAFPRYYHYSQSKASFSTPYAYAGFEAELKLAARFTGYLQIHYRFMKSGDISGQTEWQEYYQTLDNVTENTGSDGDVTLYYARGDVRFNIGDEVVQETFDTALFSTDKPSGFIEAVPLHLDWTGFAIKAGFRLRIR